LANERASLGSGMGLGKGPGPFERLIALIQHFGRNDDPLVRDQLARLYTSDRISAWTLRRGMEAAHAGGMPGAELSVLKLAGTLNLERMASFVGSVLGPRLVADTGEWGTFAWSKFVTGVPGGHLGGGTDEVLRNILGERVLGLPKDVGIDTRTPFSQLPH
jgi:alkylation response protein AidB-like acyl-CoA dehydrogenase